MEQENNSSDQNTTNRRKRFGILLLLLMFGAAVLLTLGSGTAFSASLTMDGESVTVDRGTVSDVTVDASGEVTYDGAENPPDETDVELQVQESDGSWKTIATKTETLTGVAGLYSFSFSDVSVIDNSNYNKADFKPNGDGESQSTDVKFRVFVTTDGHLDGADNRENTEFNSNPDTATVTVINEENTNNAEGSGTVTPKGNNKAPADNKQ